MYPPEDGAGDEARLGEGEERDEEGCEDAEEEDVAELPPRGHDHRHLVVHQEHGQNLQQKSFHPIRFGDDFWLDHDGGGYKGVRVSIMSPSVIDSPPPPHSPQILHRRES